ncbi:1-aminocyclopropane-1-carboxylate oxidase 1-like [Rutidosis leptorrhynchoides]|uniref:1-aminocyclopropane-1-carboxylate oxidase 1-like n=1 Tax=Rutidosis leptorrhynchoides TaxID=125765 RepID=UPI003A9A3C72
MANWPESFRAPPPSPVASGRKSSVANDEILTQFLHQSLRVPDLVLPDRQQKSKINYLPKLDYELLDSFHDQNNTDYIFDTIAETGCFELVNHGISNQIVSNVANYGAKLFEISKEKKAVMSRSGDRMYGFVEGEENEKSEEFFWYKDDSFRSKLEGILPLDIPFSNFSDSIEILAYEIEKICEVMLKYMLEKTIRKSRFDDYDDKVKGKQVDGSVCYIYKHHQNLNAIVNDSNYMSSLRYDMIRMLIRGSEHSHTLSVHVCDGSSEFHVYSKKGWVSFCPDKDALIITIGDQLQKWSEGKYKHVMGRPISKSKEDYISMAFMYNPASASIMEKKTVSIYHQAFMFFILVLLYKFYFT